MRLFFRPAFERYTEPARRVIFYAVREAQQAGSPKLAPEHIALGLFEENRALFEPLVPAQQVEALRESLARSFAAGEAAPPGTDFPLSREAQDALAAAKKLARGGEVQPVHILAGLAAGPAGVAQTLAGYGITPERITSVFP